jgi:hypothetical protein
MNELPWFRMYGEFVTDPLIRLLSFEDQRHYVMALCMKSQGILDKEYASDDVRRAVLSSLIGLSAEPHEERGIATLDAANLRIRRLGLIDANWHPLGWDNRQFLSDSSKERVRKHRENKKKEKEKRLCNVSVTVQDAETETETESDKKDLRSASSLKQNSSSSLGEDQEVFKKPSSRTREDLLRDVHAWTSSHRIQA